MKRKLTIVLLTGDGLRHRYVASRLAAHTNLAGIISELKVPVVPGGKDVTPEDQSTIQQHFEERDAAEGRLFNSGTLFPDTDLYATAHGTINTPEVAAWIHARSPDFVVLYGSGIVNNSILNHYPERVINMHLGLSPYYRGSGTNFWPLVNYEPECVGATIHLAVPSVDAGPILAQVRPVAEVSDRIHELGCKTIKAGAEAMVSALLSFASGRMHAQTQDLSVGRVYRNRDFNAEAVRQAWNNFSNGMLANYINNREERCSRFPIKELI